MTDTRSNELQTVLNALPLIFFQKDTENRIVHTNRTAADLLGTSVDSIIGTLANQWFPEEADEYFHADQEVMRSGQPRLGIIEQLGTAGSGKQWVSTDKHPHYDAAGKVDGVLVFCRRVDGKDLAEEQRSELEAQVRYAQKLDSIGVLAAGIAHDFNNYLTIIVAGTEMALERVGRDAVDALPLQESLKAAHEAARVANQLVTYAGKSMVVSKSVNLSALIDQFKDMLQASVVQNVDLAFELDYDISSINADSAQMHQALVNIVINASEAIGTQPGKIRISTTERHCTARELMNTVIGASLSSGRYVVVTISDSGPGMSNDVLKNVFEPFFSTKKSGRGLGLATVIGTVKGHGGTLHVDSSAGNGTRIELLFPALGSDENVQATDASVLSQGESTAQYNPGAVRPGPGHRQHSVLIVDDNDAVRQVLQMFLESDGYRVLSVASGDEALHALRVGSVQIDAAIVDYCMPDANGLELFARIRLLRPDLPFLLMSGSANLVSTTQFESLPDVAFLKKPFNRDCLLHELRQLLGDDCGVPLIE